MCIRDSNGTVCPVEEEEDKDDPKLASVRRSLRDAETDEPELPDTSVDPYKYTWYQACLLYTSGSGCSDQNL